MLVKEVPARWGPRMFLRFVLFIDRVVSFLWINEKDPPTFFSYFTDRFYWSDLKNTGKFPLKKTPQSTNRVHNT